MKTYRFRHIFVGLFFLLAVQSTFAVAGEQQVIDRESLERLFVEMIGRDAPWPVEDLSVDSFSANPAMLILPSGVLEFRLLSQPHSLYLGKKKLEVAADVNGREEARITLSGELKLAGEVAVVTRHLERHHVLEADDVKLTRCDLSQIGNDVVRDTEQVVGQRLKKSMRAGGLLLTDMLEEQPLVQRGDRVLIEARSDFITVTVPGEIRSAGARGESVRVKNLMSRREVYATVVDEGTVEVVF